MFIGSYWFISNKETIFLIEKIHPRIKKFPSIN